MCLYSKLNSPAVCALPSPWCLSSDTSPPSSFSSPLASSPWMLNFQHSSNIFSWHCFPIQLFLSFPSWKSSLHSFSFLPKLLKVNRNFNFQGKWSLIRSNLTSLQHLILFTIHHPGNSPIFNFQGIIIFYDCSSHPLYLSLVSLPLSIIKYWCFLPYILLRTFFGNYHKDDSKVDFSGSHHSLSSKLQCPTLY